MSTPEYQGQEKVSRTTPEGVYEIPTDVELPAEIASERTAQSVPSNFNNNVVDDDGKPLTSSPSTYVPKIDIPYSNDELSGWKKGSYSQSKTWLLAFWERVKKKLSADRVKGDS